METNNTNEVINAAAFLKNWQANRGLTRRVLAAFPEKELFEFSIGGMRPFATMIKELLAIAVPGLQEIVSNSTTKLDEELKHLSTKDALLAAWDADTKIIDDLYQQILPQRFHETINLFGQYPNAIIDSLTYFVENEIHHRGQGYVYLRALEIEPPFFWEK